MVTGTKFPRLPIEKTKGWRRGNSSLPPLFRAEPLLPQAASLDPAGHSRSSRVRRCVEKPRMLVAPCLLKRSHVEIVRRQRLEFCAELYQIPQHALFDP